MSKPLETISSYSLGGVTGGYAYRVPTPAAWNVTAPSGRTVRVQIGDRQGYNGGQYSRSFTRAKEIANRMGGGTTVNFSRFRW